LRRFSCTRSWISDIGTRGMPPPSRSCRTQPCETDPFTARQVAGSRGCNAQGAFQRW
jgi:hypothetical protein